MAPTGGDYDYGRGVHADHRDLLNDSNIINEDDFEDGLIQRGYVQDDQGRYHHPRQAGRLAPSDDFDDSEDEGMRGGRRMTASSRASRRDCC